MRSAQPTHGARLGDVEGSETLALGPEARPRTNVVTSGPAAVALLESRRYAHATPSWENTVVSAGLTPARAARTTSASESRLGSPARSSSAMRTAASRAGRAG